MSLTEKGEERRERVKRRKKKKWKYYNNKEKLFPNHSVNHGATPEFLKRSLQPRGGEATRILHKRKN